MSRQAWTVAAVLGVVAMVCVLAGDLYAQFLEAPRGRWDGIVHDRHGHYAYGLKMALALRGGDLYAFVSELEKGKVWPPVHGLLVAGVGLVAGPRHQLAVLPSLLGWVMTVCLVFLVARRSVPNGRGAELAGGVALVLAASSPAHRVFATDVMLESLGAGLTLLVVYLFQRARRNGQTPRDWRALALALTVLFFEKSNYWLLAVLAVFGSYLAANPGEAASRGWSMLGATAWRPWIRAQARHPLTYAVLAVVAIVLGVLWNGPTVIEVGGQRVSLYPPRNLLTVAYTLLFVRVALAWRRRPPPWWRAASPATRALGLWHGLPVLVSFLMPGRLAAILWHLSPANAASPGDVGVIRAARFYAPPFASEYHVGLWIVIGVLVLFGVAIARARPQRPEETVAICLAVVGTVLVLLHPNRQTRFLHTWVPAVWVGAGIGAAALVYGSEVLRNRAGLRRLLAIACVIGLALAQGEAWRSAGYSSQVGHRLADASLLDVTDTYLPRLAETRRVTVFGTLPAHALVEWSFLERYPEKARLDVDSWGPARSVDALTDRFAAWLTSTQSDAVVFIDVPPESRFYVDLGALGYDYGIHRRLDDLLRAQSVFRLTDRWELERYSVTISAWERGERSPAGYTGTP